MSYQVLARKWRPKNFASLVGQEHVVRALSNALDQQRLHHAYLFTGTRGVGKTTLARILAKALNCETGISSQPCETCASCREIDSGRFVDLIEVDAATNTKVEEMRQLLENAQYAPTRARFKVYVIDEVHMLSNSAFNAMLKTLEEPPPYLKFILATTDPQKIPVTILSRCLQFNLKQMAPASIVPHLEQILGAEQIAYEVPGLWQIAHAAAGSMRDALSLLDQAIAHGGGKVLGDAVRDMLGAVDRGYLYTILEALARADAPAMLAVAEQMNARSLSFDAALQELGTLLHRIALVQSVPQALAGEEDSEQSRIGPLVATLGAEDVQLYYQIVIHGRRDLMLAPDEYAGFSMTLLRLYAFRPGAPLNGSGQSPSGSEGKSRVVASSAAGAAPVVAARMAVQTAISAPARQAARSPSPPVERSAPATTAGVSGSPVVVAPQRSAAPMAADQAAGGLGGLPDLPWAEILSRAKITGMAKLLAQHCELRERHPGAVQLVLPELHKHLLSRSAQDRIQQGLSELAGGALRVTIELGAVQSLTPAAHAQNERDERQRKAVEIIEQDSFVRELVEGFNATIGSIRPA